MRSFETLTSKPRRLMERFYCNPLIAAFVQDEKELEVEQGRGDQTQSVYCLQATLACLFPTLEGPGWSGAVQGIIRELHGIHVSSFLVFVGGPYGVTLAGSISRFSIPLPPKRGFRVWRWRGAVDRS